MMKYMLASCWLLLIGFQQAKADNFSSGYHFDEYFTVREEPFRSASSSLKQPDEILLEFIHEIEPYFAQLENPIYSLINFTHHPETYGNVAEPYRRARHFGGWVDDHRDKNCYNTRAKVLIRDSSVPVTFRSNGCSVRAGMWKDPYAGGFYKRAADIQVDHFVPLKNAYMSGAHKWNFAKRCLYANFLGNNFHLLPVYGPENSAKSDMSPEGYMPPEKSYRCQYLSQWLKVKMIWSLGLTPPEKDAVLRLAQAESCDARYFVYRAEELSEQRNLIMENINLCNEVGL